MDPVDTCLVCHEAIEIFAIGRCDHPICFKCSTRMRALCDQFYCPICRTDLPEVFFMEKLEKFGEMPVRKFILNRKLKIQFENESVRQKFEKLLEHRCKLCPDRPADRSFKALRDHMRRQHTLFFCDLCVELKIFTSERKVYNRQELASHRRVGDKDDTSYKGHPLCEFCDWRYLDKDELYKHLRKDHFYCHFCDVHGSHDYFSDYDVLREHFRTQHYLCEEGECVDVKFENAFRSEIDYKSHRATHHKLSKQQAKQERTINIDINLPPRAKPTRGRGGSGYENEGDRGRRHYDRGGRGGGRDREDRDLERALQASLSTMKEDNQKKIKTVEKKEEEFRPTVDNFPTLGSVEDNFPTLGGVSTASVPATTASVTEVSSLAERFAMANMLPMNYHAQPNSLNDFPSLQQDYRPKSASNPNLITKSVPSKNANKSSFKSAMGSMKREEDFPELISSKKPVKPQPAGAWVKPGDNPYHNDNKTSSKTSVKPNKTKQLKNKSISDTNDLFHKVYDDNDFPTLGGKKSQTVAQGSGWKQIGKTSPVGVQQSESGDSQNSAQSQEEIRTDPHSVIERFSPVNVLPDSNDKKPNKNKNQKKKKKEKDKESTVMNKQTSKVRSESGAGLRGNSSLDNIANLLLSPSEPISDSEKENKIQNNTDNLSSHYVEEPARNGSPLSFSAGNFHKNTPTFDDEPSITKPKPVKFQAEENEFPALGAPAKVRKPPPGFMSDEPKSTPPPGFSKASSDKSGPPPGFGTKSTSKAENDLAKYNLTNSMPLSAHLVDFDSFKYSQPSDFNERNRQLIGDIQALLVDEPFKFVEFKSLSGEFRKRDIDADSYFRGCEDILGKDNFAVIFPELIALLPDIDKQHELLEIYMKKEGIRKDSKDVINISRKSRNAKGAWTSTQSGFLTCQTCRQVLLRKDYNSHVSQHNLDADFPSLGIESGPVSTAVGYGSWVKAK